jgi:phosphonate transport system substrate-binding protein
MTRIAFSIFFIFVLGFLLSSCVPTSVTNTGTYVDLGNLSPLPTPMENHIEPLKVAIAAVISPQGSAESYALLLDYLSEELGRPVESVQRRTYAEVNDLLRTGEVDLAFVCTSAYILGRNEFGMRLLVAPQVNGEAIYHARIIVPVNSTVQSMADLRGTRFAFTDPMSFTGRMYPTYVLQQMGETPETFFASTFFTFSHDDAIYAVADGISDGASVDGFVLDFAMKRNPELASRIRIIHTSEPFGIPPVVVGPEIRPQLQAQLQEILLNLHQTADGQNALDALDLDRFVLMAEDDYNSVEVIESSLDFFSTDAP